MWIYVPRGFCPSAPESADSTKASEWRSHLLASSAALSTKHTPATSWLRAWKKKPWIQLLFGRIYEPSTAAHGVASWMESLEGTPASRSVRPGSEKAPTTHGTSGPRSTDSSTRSSLAGASSRMSADTSPSDSTLSTQTFADVVTALKLDYSARRKWVRAIDASASSSSQWKTPRTRGREGDTGSAQRQLEGPNEGLNDQVKYWATPRTITGGPESSKRKQELGRVESGGGDLQAQVEMWATPTAPAPHDSEVSCGRERPDRPGYGLELVNQACRWPTPNQRDHKGSDLKSRNGGASLSHFAETGERVHSRSLPQAQVTSVSGGKLSPTEISTALRRRLNPAFVCWLMGLPWWWTNPVRNSFARSATESYLFRLRMHLASLLARWESFSRR